MKNRKGGKKIEWNEEMSFILFIYRNISEWGERDGHDYSLGCTRQAPQGNARIPAPPGTSLECINCARVRDERAPVSKSCSLPPLQSQE